MAGVGWWIVASPDSIDAQVAIAAEAYGGGPPFERDGLPTPAQRPTGTPAAKIDSMTRRFATASAPGTGVGPPSRTARAKASTSAA